jgi:DNA-binding transcriptional ArsR family regulator
MQRLGAARVSEVWSTKFVWSAILDQMADRRALADYDADDVLVVSEAEQLRALGDDLRSRIVALLRERARSTQELSKELCLPKGTVGYHLKVLERAGLIHVVRTRRVRAVTERYYGRVAHLFLFKSEDQADTRAMGTLALRRAAEQVERAPAGANFALVRARLTPADARRLERRLDRLVHDFRSSDTMDGEPTGLATAFWTAEEADA